MKQLMCAAVELNDAAGASKDRFFCPTHPDGGEWALVAANWSPDTTVATDGSNYRTISLKRASVTFGSLTTNSSGGAAFTAGTVSAFTLSNHNSPDGEFTANTDSIEIDSTYTGTGGIALGRVSLVFERRS